MMTWLSSLPLATLQAMLASASTAYDNLVTGKQVKVFTDQNGQHVEYTPVGAPSLRLYVEELEIAIAQKTRQPHRQFTRPLRFIF